MPDIERQNLPTPEMYGAAFRDSRDRISLKGGVKTVLAQRAVNALIDPTIAASDNKIRSYGFYLADPFVGIDDERSVAVQDAYLRGYRLTQRVLNELYNTPFTVDDYLSPLAKSLEAVKPQDFPNEEHFFLNTRRTVVRFGGNGLEVIGDDASEVLDDISVEAYDGSNELSTTFMLGAGSVVLGAEHYQRAINNRLIELMASNIDEEAIAFFNET